MLGTVGGNYAGKYKFKNTYFENLLKPALSGYTGEVLGNTNNFRKLLEKEVREDENK